MGAIAERPESVPDPLLYGCPLPIVTTFYPFGYGLELATDSPEIAAAAAAVWSRYPKLSELPPVRLRVAVSGHDATVAPAPAMPRGQEHLVSIVHGTENFAVADLARGFGYACLTRDVACDGAYTTFYFLEPLAYLLLAAKYVTILHAACIALEGRAVLLCGDSGTGKTCLSYACARLGWTFLSGDATQFVRDADQIVIGRPFSLRFRESARELFPELMRYAPASRLNGKVDIEPRVEDLNISVGLQAHATHLVFLQRSPLALPPTLAPVSAEEALRRLEHVINFGDQYLRAEQTSALARFVQSRPACCLIYSDMAEAERILRSLVTGDRLLQ